MVTASAAQTAVDVVQVMLLAAAVGVLALVAVATRRAVRAWQRWRSRLQAAVAGATTPAWWAAQRERHRLWRAVSAAEHAVARARAAGAPVGELPSIVRRLGSAAQTLDAALASGAQASRPGDELRRQADRLTAAAAEVSRAVAATLAADTRPQIDRVVDEVGIEVAALRHGWSSLAVPGSPHRA